MREQYDQSRKKVSRNCLLLGALEVVLGVLVYFEIAEFPSLPFTDSRLPEAVGFAAVYYGAYLLYWGGTLWQQAGDAEQWRQTVSRIAEKFCSHPTQPGGACRAHSGGMGDLENGPCRHHPSGGGGAHPAVPAALSADAPPVIPGSSAGLPDCVSGGPVSSYRTILTHSSVRFREIHRKHNFSGISEKNACNRHPSVIL